MSGARRWALRALAVGAAVGVATTSLGVLPGDGVVLASASVGAPSLRSFELARGPRTVPRERSFEGLRDARLEVLFGEWRATRSPAALEATLRELAARGAPRARLQTIGEGREGRAMLALELGATGTPGILVVPGTVAHAAQLGDGPGAEGELYGALDELLELARELVVGSSPSSEERARIWARLEAQRVVVLFGARPDLLAPRLAAPGFDPARNFPVDWDLAQQSGGGPYPLAMPETRALARWLDAEPRLFAAALVGVPPVAAESLALGADAADSEQARLLEGPHVRARVRGEAGEVAPVYGGFARHARLRAGLAVVALPLQSPIARPEARATPIDDAGVAMRVFAELLDAAPRLELALDPAPRAVGTDLWQVDAVLANVGGLGTANVAHARGRQSRGIRVSVAGGELVVGAVRVGDGPFQVVEPHRDSDGRVHLRTLDLDAGARLSVRLFVRLAAERASERGRERPIEVRAEAPRALPARSFVTPATER